MELSNCKMIFKLPFPQTNVDTMSGCHRKMLGVHFCIKEISKKTFFSEGRGSFIDNKYTSYCNQRLSHTVGDDCRFGSNCYGCLVSLVMFLRY